MCKLRHKMRNGQNLSQGNQNFRNNFDDRKSLSQIKILFLFLGFQKHIVSKRLGLLVFEKLFLKIKFYIDSSCFKCIFFSTLHNVNHALHLHLQTPLNLNMYTSYYTLKTVHCTPQVYTEFVKFITLNCKNPNLPVLVSRLTWQNVS